MSYILVVSPLLHIILHGLLYLALQPLEYCTIRAGDDLLIGGEQAECIILEIGVELGSVKC